jgi:hypothetical protein
MKKEMALLPNGNYEEIVSPIQHKCFHDSQWTCVEYGWDLGKLILEIEDGDPYENGYSNETIVNFCPFCGYKPEKLAK